MRLRSFFAFILKQRSGLVYFLLLALFCSCTGCSSHRNKKENKSNEISLETMIRINRELVKKEQKKIKAYIENHKLDMLQTGTGLWYRIENERSGPLVKKGQVVDLKYNINLLDGTRCYCSDSLGLKTFKVGQGGVESGLEEGVLLLKKGSRALFIMPPHLAHGLIGDDDKIPARAILWYEVEILNVRNP